MAWIDSTTMCQLNYGAKKQGKRPVLDVGTLQRPQVIVLVITVVINGTPIAGLSTVLNPPSAGGHCKDQIKLYSGELPGVEPGTLVSAYWRSEPRIHPNPSDEWGFTSPSRLGTYSGAGVLVCD